MKKISALSCLMLVLLLSACSKESPELVPCMCDGTESDLGVFNCMCEPFKKKPVKRISYIQDENPSDQMMMIDREQRDAFLYLHQRRDVFAPVKLEYVDFRIKKGRKYDEFDTKLGNYRFRIFGCRRESQNVFLNQGRAMQKDMRFFDVFFEEMNDYYPVVVDRKNPYFVESDRIEVPEYLMTAEINDYFMNVCDEFDWNEVKNKKLRSGSSEITVTWRLMDLTREQVYCKGTTTGYGQISEGEPEGETLLVERAFQDALSKVPEIDCYNRTLAQRVSPNEIARQLVYLQEMERRNQSFGAQYEAEIKGVKLLQSCASGIGENYGSSVRGNNIGSQGVLQDCSSTQITNVGIEENYGSSTKGASIDSQGGLNHGAAEFNGDSCTTVKTMGDNVTIKDDYWVDVPLNDDSAKAQANREAAENSFLNSANRFCIQNQAPYDNLNPHNLYKVRASVVEVENATGKKGAGLIIADNLILTSADLMVKENNNFKIKTINGGAFKGSAFRVNPNKNVALLLLEDRTQYTSLPLSLDLPEVNKDVFMTLGLFNLETEGEGYIDNGGKVTGYRYSEERGSEIIVDTFVQTVSIGGALIDKNGNIVGLAHDGKKTDDTPDLFIPIETALKSLGLEICGRNFSTQAKPKAVKTFATPLADAVDASKGDIAPKAMQAKERK